MSRMFESLESRRMFSTPQVEELPAISMELGEDMPSAPLFHNGRGTSLSAAKTPQVRPIDPDFFVRPPLKRAG